MRRSFQVIFKLVGWIVLLHLLAVDDVGAVGRSAVLVRYRQEHEKAPGAKICLLLLDKVYYSH